MMLMVLVWSSMRDVRVCGSVSRVPKVSRSCAWVYRPTEGGMGRCECVAMAEGVVLRRGKARGDEGGRVGKGVEGGQGLRVRVLRGTRGRELRGALGSVLRGALWSILRGVLRRVSRALV